MSEYCGVLPLSWLVGAGALVRGVSFILACCAAASFFFYFFNGMKRCKQSLTDGKALIQLFTHNAHGLFRCRVTVVAAGF